MTYRLISVQRSLCHKINQFSFALFNNQCTIATTDIMKHHSSAPKKDIAKVHCENFLWKQSLHTSIVTASYKNLALLEYMKQLLHDCINGAMKDQHTHLSTLVSNESIEKFCSTYEILSENEKQSILLYICETYGVQHEEVINLCNTLSENMKSGRDDATFLQSEERLRSQLQPTYSYLFKLIGRLDGGVKFITDLRYDALTFAASASSPNSRELRDLSNHLKEMLSIWFSVGLLKLTRIMWKTPADILEKVAKNEAVHQVRSWNDLKHRLGNDRRCYAFFHNSMPREPLVLLHVAITNDITEKITGIVDYTSSDEILESDVAENTTAIFYSITSTQNGLKGIEFGIHMIRAVVQELRSTFPNLQNFSSLSPIPRFHNWLLNLLANAMKTECNVFLPNEMRALKSVLEVDNDQLLVEQISAILAHKSWTKDEKMANALKYPLMRLCAVFLHEVKSRGYAFDPVANFHLQNGAMLWRINWMADPSVKGFKQSFGIMVNYRYYLDRMEGNSKDYMLNQNMSVSDSVLNLKSNDFGISQKAKL